MGGKVLRFHGHEIDLQPNPIGRLNKECVQGKDLKDEKIVFMAVFVKTRFFHRIKVLNNEAKLKEKIRSVKQQSQFMFWFDNKYLFYNKPFPFIYCNQGMLFLLYIYYSLRLWHQGTLLFVYIHSSCVCTTDLYSDQSTSTPKSILLDARMKTKEDDINFRVRVLII